ncbi:hypothetical protein [Piscirickettsia salmonis]|nr:hypothetical protein [Piscirickettsia salmonis]
MLSTPWLAAFALTHIQYKQINLNNTITEKLEYLFGIIFNQKLAIYCF